MIDGTVFGDYRLGGRRVLWTLPPAPVPVPPPVPVIIELHGSGLGPEAQLRCSGLHRRAAELGVAIAAPEAAIPLRLFADAPAGAAWNVPGAPLVAPPGAPATAAEPVDAPDDLAFVRAVLDHAPVATAEIFVVGFSGGGRLASWLASTLGDRLAGVVTVAGLRLVVPHGPHGPHAPPPLLAFHGDRDTINPFAGGGGPRWAEGVRETAAAFAQQHGWTTDADERISRRVLVSVARDAAQQPRLVHYLIERGLHAWPGSRDPAHRRLFGEPTTELDATAEIWRFVLARLRGR